MHIGGIITENMVKYPSNRLDTSVYLLLRPSGRLQKQTERQAKQTNCYSVSEHDI